MTVQPEIPAPGVDDIVAALEDDIIFGRLHPFQELAEDPLVARFGAKRHVIRSALQTLARRGIVVKPMHKSARVRDFTPTEVDQIYSMRALLQREAAMTTPLPGPADLLEALNGIHADYTTAVRARTDLRAIHQLNDAFHDALFAACGNPYLAEMIRHFTDLSNPIRSYGIADPSWLDRAVQEHAGMIEAIATGDRNGLARMVVDHMQPTRERWFALRR